MKYRPPIAILALVLVGCSDSSGPTAEDFVLVQRLSPNPIKIPIEDGVERQVWHNTTKVVYIKAVEWEIDEDDGQVFTVSSLGTGMGWTPVSAEGAAKVYRHLQWLKRSRAGSRTSP